MVNALRTLAAGWRTEEMERLLAIGNTVIYPAELQKAAPYSQEIITALAEKFLLAIVTSRRCIGVESYFAIAPLRDYFSTIIAVEDVSKKKPHPEPLLMAIRQLGVTCAEAVYVGDSAVDVEAAKAAGMKIIACTDVPGADAYFSSFRELPDVIDKLSRSSP